MLRTAAGSNPSFVAKAVGLQAMRYQWKFNGNDIVGATADTYVITNAQVANAGTYSLTLSNSIGALGSRPAKLAVVQPSTNPAPIRLRPFGFTNGQFGLCIQGAILSTEAVTRFGSR